MLQQDPKHFHKKKKKNGDSMSQASETHLMEGRHEESDMKGQ